MKKIISIILVFVSMFLLSSCELFEPVSESIPAGYNAVAYTDKTFDLEGICKNKTVFAIYPGSAEQGNITDKIKLKALTSLSDISEDTDFKDPNKLVYVDDVKAALVKGDDVVVIVAPGLSSKGLGSAAINGTTETKRAEDICKLKDTYSTKLTIIEFNLIDYSKDSKSPTMINTIMPYADCVIFDSKTVCNVLREPAVSNNLPTFEVKSTELFDLFDYMFD